MEYLAHYHKNLNKFIRRRFKIEIKKENIIDQRKLSEIDRFRKNPIKKSCSNDFISPGDETLQFSKKEKIFIKVENGVIHPEKPEEPTFQNPTKKKGIVARLLERELQAFAFEFFCDEFFSLLLKSLMNCGHLYTTIGKHYKARAYYKKAIELSHKFNLSIYPEIIKSCITVYLTTSKIHIQNFEFIEAKKYLRSIID
jgi:tetratricopeptide (TPR) repeat protein